MSRVLRVGLTGGSACGKTTVARFLEDLGTAVIDADAVARRLLEPDGAAFEEVLREFGDSIRGPDGTIDRKRLAQLVFSDPARRKRLESIIHPRIAVEEDRMVRLLRRDPAAQILVTDAALLVETGAWRRYDALIVVHCHRDTQIDRLTTGKGLSRSEAEMRLAAQWSNEDKIRHADFSIDTDRDREDTRKEVREVFAALRKKLGDEPPRARDR
jgi:dephospho-CoA kinase